ncbi:hypothetical protein GF386_05425 [Candidatus Pacearchaeota archaeon]|nr:hypothetical protein [Candidatus Pacearchaeota archaeon]MBD3283531.1 hypothetical protein [Candidatus Pacearchaeota archaeon]
MTTEKQIQTQQFPRQSLRFQQEVVKPRQLTGEIRQKKAKFEKQKKEVLSKIKAEQKRIELKKVEEQKPKVSQKVYYEVKGRRYTPGEVKQVKRLIFSGKAWVVGRDPHLRPLANYLIEHGYKEPKPKAKELPPPVIVKGKGYSIAPSLIEKQFPEYQFTSTAEGIIGEKIIEEKKPEIQEVKKVEAEEKSFISKATEKYKKAEETISEKIPFKEQYKKTAKVITETAPYPPSVFGIGSFGIKSRGAEQFHRGVSYGIITAPVEKPLTTGVMYGVGLITAPSLQLGGKILKPVTKLFPKTAKVTGKAISYGLPTLYGTSAAYRIGTQPTMKKAGEKTGEIISTELLPLGMGGYTSAKYYPKIESYFRTRGRTEIFQEKIIPEDVLTGEKHFPEAPPREHLKLFLKKSQRVPGYEEPMMFHSTGDVFWKSKFKVVESKSEFPGLYGSYGVSPHFLRITKEPKISFYSERILEPYGKPGTIGIIPKKFVKGKIARPGEAFVPGIKTEVEAVLPPSTKVEITGKKYFFRWGGQRIPLDIGRTTFDRGKGIKIKNVLGSYRTPSSYPITTPASYFGSSLIELSSLGKPSYKSWLRGVSSEIPITKLSKPSKLSSKPSSKPRITRTSKLKYKPSGFSSYYPPSYLKSSSKPPKTPTLRPPFYVPPKKPPRKPPKIKMRFEFKKDKKKKKKRKLFQPTRYTPSFTARVFGFKARRKPKEIKKGLGYTPKIRPILR